ncbi:catalase protein [Rutstroemia sp. NJR-2017a BVV2]|nr:catalase protein [Rutstroemia sp. NJR-2017a BVV2]
MASMLNNPQKPTYTSAEGVPIADPTTSVRLNTFGQGALLLLQDTQLIEQLAHFARERIPERVVHAQGAGAFGEFEVTHDISDLTSADFLTGVGKKTPCMVRISTVGGERGFPDVVRDVRGFAMKFYTAEGNQDFVFNNTPIFFIRDPIKFPSMNRSHKRHPRTNAPDVNMFWDYHNNNPEGTHQIMYLFSKRGTPASLRNLNAYSGNTYKLTKLDGSFKYVRFHFKADQNVINNTAAEAEKLAGASPDHHKLDLFNAIEKGEYPTWTASVQVMDPKDAESYRWNIFDITKVWPHGDVPLRPFGKMTLNRNPNNVFEDVEQAAFSPSNIVPGIAASPDPILQSRLFSYPDAARYRLGTNYQQLPTNRAHCPVYQPFQRDGRASIHGNYGPDPNYVRASSLPLAPASPNVLAVQQQQHEAWSGKVVAWTSEVVDDDFVQARMFWKDVLGKQEGEQEALVSNLAENLKSADETIRKEAIAIFGRVDLELAQQIEKKIEELLKA